MMTADTPSRLPVVYYRNADGLPRIGRRSQLDSGPHFLCGLFSKLPIDWREPCESCREGMKTDPLRVAGRVHALSGPADQGSGVVVHTQVRPRCPKLQR